MMTIDNIPGVAPDLPFLTLDRQNFLVIGLRVLKALFRYRENWKFIIGQRLGSPDIDFLFKKSGEKVYFGRFFLPSFMFASFYHLVFT